jgi:hypothetical protein
MLMASDDPARNGLQRRTNEIGIRMALGADRGRVIRSVLAQAFLRVLADLGLGFPLALGAARLIANQLYGVSFWDPLALTVAAGRVLLARGQTSSKRTSWERCRAVPILRVADVHVSQLSRENRILPTRATEERAKSNIRRTHNSQRVPLGGGSCRSQNRTSICCLRPRRAFSEV